MTFHVDRVKCIGCSYCKDVCRHKAISIQDKVASICQELCTQCGKCSGVCPVGRNS